MLFNSFAFVGFFVIVWSVIALLQHRALPSLLFKTVQPTTSAQGRNAVLLVASYAFYAAWDVRFVALIALSTAVDFLVGLRLMRTRRPSSRRALVATSIASNLGILGVFKYYDFFATSLGRFLDNFGWAYDPILLDVILPVGISFYTFQTLSYTIDVYRNDVVATTNPLHFALFVAFFPQLVAGPIERARDLLPQFAVDRPITFARMDRGLHLIGAGLLKKVVLADNLALIVNDAFSRPGSTGLSTLIGAYAFAVQIYCDFSGYSDIARGTACCLGFDLSRNFARPYLARGPREFWRRWHVTLSEWLRDYLYIPLGGARGSVWKVIRNVGLTMMLGGLWHGASWTFVLWGFFHGVVIVVYRALEQPVARCTALLRLPRLLCEFIGITLFFHIVCVGWLLFRADSVTQAATMLASLWASPWRDEAKLSAALVPCAVGTAVLMATELYGAWRGTELPVLQWPPLTRSVVYAAGIITFVLFGAANEVPFIYFQF